MSKPTHWWSERPEWLEGAYAETEEGLDWLSESASSELGSRLAAAYETDQGPYGFGLGSQLLEEFRGVSFLPLAQLPQRFDRRGQVPCRPTLFFDPQRPEQLWIGFDENAPPLFWIPAGQSAKTIRAAFSPYEAKPFPKWLELTESVRGFVGTMRDLGAGSLDDVARYFRTRPGIDSLPWGTAYDADPWPEEVKGSAIALSMDEQELSAQRHDAIPALSFRSVLSGSILSISDFQGQLIVEIRYRPVEASIFPALNKKLSSCYPEDLPADVVMALLGGPFDTAEVIEKDLTDPEKQNQRIGDAVIYTALVHDDLRRLRWLLTDVLNGTKEERLVAMQIADRFELVTELCAMLATEEDPELRQNLLDWTTVGGAS